MQRFLVDLMLMRLGRWLRLLGQDVANPEDESDELLLLLAGKESRTIITRDLGLLQACQSAGIPCLFIRSSDITEQLQEVADFGVPLRLDPQRCTLCNGILEEMAQSGEKMRWQCRNCRNIYWKGSHWQKIESMLDSVRRKKEGKSKSSFTVG
jgi:uncharacterized protein with PIN domain